MNLHEFFDRLDADPFAREITELFQPHFTITVPQSRNYCASDLLHDYSPDTFRRDRYFCPVINYEGKPHAFDHWKIKKNTDGTETVTVYLRGIINYDDVS